MYWMTLPLKRYFDFRGRSRRKEYWLFTLFIILGSIVLGIIDGALGLTIGGDDAATTTAFSTSNGVLGSIFSLATFIPSISVGVRRLHDTNRTGWWILLPLLTLIVGGLVLLVFYVLDGTPGPNRYGDDPKDPVGDVAEVFR